MSVSMMARRLAKIVNLFVVVSTVLTVIPSGLLVSAAPAATPLPPPPALSLDEVFAPATGEALLPDLAGEAAPRGVLASPRPSGGEGAPSQADEQALLREESREEALGALGVRDEKDLDMPLLDFLAKHPQLRARAAAVTGIGALAFPDYRFSEANLGLLNAKLNLLQYKATTPGGLIPYADLAPPGVRTPLAYCGPGTPCPGANVLVIDDDGSTNNGGPTVVGWEWTNQTALVVASLENVTPAITWDVYVRPYLGEGPTFATLSSYDRVIYVSGQNLNAWGLSAMRRMVGYLEAEGDLWAIGQLTLFAMSGLTQTDRANFTMVQELGQETADFVGGYIGASEWLWAGVANPMNGTAAGFLTGQQYTFTRNIRENRT